MKTQDVTGQARGQSVEFKRWLCLAIWSVIAFVWGAGVVLGFAPAPVELGACCDSTLGCVGDLTEADCAFGTWHRGASCGANPDLPPPICTQTTCRFDNGLPLDDGGAPRSQYAPDSAAAYGAVDDFVLGDGSATPCRLTSVRAWMTHNDLSVNPTVHYQGVNVTIYATDTQGKPDGRPVSDGSHTSASIGGIVYTQRIAMANIEVTQQLASCLTDLWQLDIPIDTVLPEDHRYWLEVQPVMNASVGEAHHVLSINNNRGYAFGFDAAGGTWQVAAGNTDACGGLPTPVAATRRNLAFEIIGTTSTAPASDNCVDALRVGDGVVSFYNTSANTDGPIVPALCGFFGTEQLSKDVWFDYQAECSGELTVNLCGSAFDTELAVYDGCGACPPRGEPVACNEDATEVCGLQSHVVLPVTLGDCLTIRAGGWVGAAGRGRLTIDCVAPLDPTGACCVAGQCTGTTTDVDCAASGGSWAAGATCPAYACPVLNDECVDSIPVFTGVPYVGTTVGSTGFDVSSCGAGDSNDVWHTWTADCDGAVDIGLCDSLFDTTLAVYDACDTLDLVCNDDHCSSQSAIVPRDPRENLVLPVTVGEVLYIRVSGFNGARGQYTLNVNGCVNNGCCANFPAGRCYNLAPTTCQVAGSPLPDGILCEGDGDRNGIDDACEGCPSATIGSAEPAHGTVDARQPSEPRVASPRQGIGSPGATGSPREPIVIRLDPPAVGAEGCFSLCETAADPVAGPNAISGVTYLGSGSYEIVLTHAIAAGAVTTIQYTGDGSYVSYTSHPSNVDADAAADAADIASLIDCCLSDLCTPVWGLWSCDIDHSGSAGPGDVLRTIDLLNGGDVFEVWGQTGLPTNSTCP